MPFLTSIHASWSSAGRLIEVRALKAHGSDATSEDHQAAPARSGGLKRGDKVRVIRKMTWMVPHPERGEYLHNVNVGREGVIEGFTDETQSKVLLTVQLVLDGVTQAVTRPCYPRNVALVDGAPPAKDAAPEEPPTKKHRKKEKGEDKEAWKFLVGDSLEDDVVVHKTWPDFSSQEEDLFKTFLLRSRIGMCLDSLAAVVGRYTA